MALDYSVDGGVAVVKLNRPEVLNAFNDELGFATLEAVQNASADGSVRCIVITGTGRGFSAGEDLGALAEVYDSGEAPGLGNPLVERYNPLVRAIRNAPKPVLAAINGVAAGAGASIAFACDFRIAAENVKMSLAFVKVGLVPDSGGIWFLTKMIGAARAWELAATGDPLTAPRCLELGLVNKVVPPEDFEAAWRSWAADLAAGPTRAYALIKSLANNAATLSLEEQLEAEVDAQAAAGQTKDHLEGVQAFMGKRPAVFEGQ
jgi:2-(1,2-epoxy-1,2-dihydrophenyl)acetyl-CoA isomerase